jgi:hypothetical protein
MPPLPDPDVADIAPSGPDLTIYDEEHGITYLRLLDADAEGADLQEVSRIVLCGLTRRRSWSGRDRLSIVILRRLNG